jgi:hypothetical protein
MSKSTVLQLIDDIAFGMESASPVGAFYDDLMWDAARWGVSTNVVLIPATARFPTYTTPANEARIYGIFYDDVLLSLMTLRQLEAVNAQWRDELGRSRSYISQDEPEHSFTVYPTPNEDSQSFVFLFGSPLGRDFPARALGAIIGERRDDLPGWLDIPLALSVLGREYERDSEHADPTFAKACRSIGAQLLALVLA